MKTNKNPNPHAFPGNGGWANGMTLRDYFAAAALPAIINTDTDSEGYGDIVERAYAVADAMLAERALE